MRRIRPVGKNCSAWFATIVLAALPLKGQTAEPILTKTAIPFNVDTGAVKLDYAGGFGKQGASSQVIPEGTLEVGVYRRLEGLVRFPLILVTRPSPSPSVVGGGQLAVGARYLVAGAPDRTYAIALQFVVEAPTGDTRLVGNATQLMPAILADFRPFRNAAFYSNITLDRSVTGSSPGLTFFEYSSAVTWFATRHLVPAFELAGSTNTLTNITQFVAQPELIVRTGRHLEWKAGFDRGLNPHTVRTGVHAQLAWLWSSR